MTGLMSPPPLGDGLADGAHSRERPLVHFVVGTGRLGSADHKV